MKQIIIWLGSNVTFSHEKIQILVTNKFYAPQSFNFSYQIQIELTMIFFYTIVPSYCDQTDHHMIGGKCYYFSRQNLDFDAQQSECGTKFEGRGRLFEPRSLTVRLGPSENGLGGLWTSESLTTLWTTVDCLLFSEWTSITSITLLF